MTDTTKKKTYWTKNHNSLSKMKTIRVPFDLLEESNNEAELMGISWAEFVKEAITEKIERRKKAEA